MGLIRSDGSRTLSITELGSVARRTRAVSLTPLAAGR